MLRVAGRRFAPLLGRTSPASSVFASKNPIYAADSSSNSSPSLKDDGFVASPFGFGPGFIGSIRSEIFCNSD
jgi:hypothetical protein